MDGQNWRSLKRPGLHKAKSEKERLHFSRCISELVQVLLLGHVGNPLSLICGRGFVDIIQFEAKPN